MSLQTASFLYKLVDLLLSNMVYLNAFAGKQEKKVHRLKWTFCHYLVSLLRLSAQLLLRKSILVMRRDHEPKLFVFDKCDYFSLQASLMEA